MPTQAQNLSRQMILRAYKALILSAYKAALQMSRTRYNCRGSATNRLLFMQNKPNSLRGQINATLCAAKDYENKWQRRVRKNKPKTNPILIRAKMNVNFYLTKDYEEKCG